MQNDPTELDNLAQRAPERLLEMVEKWKASADRVSAPTGPFETKKQAD